MKKNPIKLNRWAVVDRSNDPYLAPELRRLSLCGEAENHPVHGTSEITTSYIVGREGAAVLTKSGSAYELGEPHPDYEAAFPNAKERLFKTIPA